jgi:hypothetical protein
MRLLIPNGEHSNELARLKNQVSFDVREDAPRIVDRIVTDNDALIAYGVVRKFGEAVFITDDNVSRFKRARALDALMEVAIMASRKCGLEQLHVFVKDPKLASSLEKHYGFVRNTDIILIRDL